MSETIEAQRSAKREEYLRFVARIYPMRALGLGAGCTAVGAVLYEQQAAWPWWVLIVFNGAVWPTLAYWLARRSARPHRTEFVNLIIDSAVGGMWIAVMGFNLLPSALLAVMLSADKVGVGGWRFLARTAAAQVIVCGVTWSALGFPWRPHTSMFVIAWCLPFMLIYPLALSTLTYALGRRVVRQNRILDRLSRIDALTELPNRRQWEEAVSAEFARGVRSGRHAALMMLDVDHFKQINDQHGHLVGDRILRELATILRSVVREVDTPGRFGGDEFGLVLIETDLTQAVDIANRTRQAVQTIRLADVPDLRCTVSIGIAVAGPDLDSMGEWIRQADLALYQAKQMGRNQVAVNDGTRAEPGSNIVTLRR